MIEPSSKTAGLAASLAALGVGSAPILGTQADVLLVAAAGALFGLAYTPPELWARWLAVPPGPLAMRGLWLLVRTGGLTFTLASNALASAWSVAAIPHIPGFAWVGQIAPQPVAGLLAFAAQHVIPRALAAAGRYLDKRATA